MRLLLDINYVLDLLLKRQPNYSAAAAIMLAIRKRRITGYIAASSFPIIYYFCYKHYSLKLDDKQARLMALSDVWTCLSEFNICAIDRIELEAAAKMSGRDFEDNIQVVCAFKEGLDAIVTSNIKDFRGLGITLYTPAQLVKRLKLR